MMHDDSESDADDECSSEDEFVVLSPDSQNKQGSGTSDEGSDSSLNIIDDYFDTLLLSLNQDIRDADLETDEIEKDCPPVIKLDLGNQPDVAMVNSVGTTISNDCKLAESDAYLGLEESIGLREGVPMVQPEDDEYNADDSGGWSMASYYCSDDWAVDIEVAEENQVSRELEAMAVPKNRRNRCSTAQIPSQSKCRGSQRNRQVKFCLIPEVISEQPPQARQHHPIYSHRRR